MTTGPTEHATEPVAVATGVWVVGVDGSEDALPRTSIGLRALRRPEGPVCGWSALGVSAIAMLPVEGDLSPRPMEGLSETIEREVYELVAAASATGIEIEGFTTYGTAARPSSTHQPCRHGRGR